MDDITTAQAMDGQLNELVRTLLRMQPVRREVIVTDPLDQITVTIDAEGRLQRVLVSPRWSERLEPAELAPSILAVIAEAQLEASGMSQQVREPSDEEVSEKRAELFRKSESVVAPSSSESELQAKIDSLPSLFGELDAALKRLDAKLEHIAVPVSPEKAARRELSEKDGVQVRSRNARVVATVNQGTVVDLTIERNWPEGKSGHVVTECLDQIIEQLNQ